MKTRKAGDISVGYNIVMYYTIDGQKYICIFDKGFKHCNDFHPNEIIWDEDSYKTYKNAEKALLKYVSRESFFPFKDVKMGIVQVTTQVPPHSWL